jgi:hypothetical protein
MGVAMRGATRRGLAWELSEDEFRVLTHANCWYCGAAPRLRLRRWPDDQANGIDRIDNAVGYTAANTVTACLPCNRAKHTMTQEAFLELARRVAERHPWKTL